MYYLEVFEKCIRIHLKEKVHWHIEKRIDTFSGIIYMNVDGI